MESDNTGCSVLFFTGFIVLIAMVFLGGATNSCRLESDIPIQPIYEIEVSKEGISDTTYIYRKN